MPRGDQAPRLNFLKESAGALSGLSPSTAAYLMNTHHYILHDDSRPVNPRQLETSCGGCGTIRCPENTRTIHVGQRKGKRAGTKGPMGDGATVSQCLRCHRRTVKASTRAEAMRCSAPPKLSSTTPLAVTRPSTSTTVAAGTESGSKAADNVNSKKRAKARKQGGLQALMASKKQSNSGSSLDLFDFLQG